MSDEQRMCQAMEIATQARLRTSPNPWVGCVIVTTDGRTFCGATEAPGQRHAEIVALDAALAAGADTQGATVYTTLEPCSHQGRTGPCTEALISAGVSRVVCALTDPDPLVGGRGLAQLRSRGIEVSVGCCANAVTAQLRPYLHQRTTGRPFVVLKMAITMDGRIAAGDGTSQWITGLEARTAAHQLRAESDAIVVGARTIRSDDPALTTRLVQGPSPRRIVLGQIPATAQVHPCTQWDGSLSELLDELGAQNVLQLMVEGGATVAGSFHEARLVDRYVLHIAPALMGGNDAPGMFAGNGAATIAEMFRGTITSTRLLGQDLEITLEKYTPTNPPIKESE